MEINNFQNEIVTRVLEVTGVKLKDIESISNNTTSIFIKLKSNKQFILHFIEEEDSKSNMVEYDLFY